MEGGLVITSLVPDKARPEVRCTMVCFRETEYELLVVDNGSQRSKTTYRNLADAMQQTKCAAGSNGGFFDIATFAPNGLLICSGKATGSFEQGTGRTAWSRCAPANSLWRTDFLSAQHYRDPIAPVGTPADSARTTARI